MTAPLPDDASRPAPRTCRVGAARHLLTPRQFRESLTLAPQPWVRIALLAGLRLR